MGSIKGQKHNPRIIGKYAHVNKNDVVFTPDWLAKEIVNMFKEQLVGKRILEPCKGEGAFMRYLPAQTEWCEITEGRNFYDYNEQVDWIITNPPYSDFNRFLTHCFELSQNVVLLVPLAKMFKSMGTIKQILEYGTINFIKILPASKAGFPFGFPCAVFWIAKHKFGNRGETYICLFENEMNPNIQQILF